MVTKVECTITEDRAKGYLKIIDGGSWYIDENGNTIRKIREAEVGYEDIVSDVLNGTAMHDDETLTYNMGTSIEPYSCLEKIGDPFATIIRSYINFNEPVSCSVFSGESGVEHAGYIFTSTVTMSDWISLRTTILVPNNANFMDLHRTNTTMSDYPVSFSSFVHTHERTTIDRGIMTTEICGITITRNDENGLSQLKVYTKPTEDGVIRVSKSISQAIDPETKRILKHITRFTNDRDLKSLQSTDTVEFTYTDLDDNALAEELAKEIDTAQKEK